MAKRADGRTTQGRFSKGTSGNPTGRRKSPRMDDWQNFATGVGLLGRDKRVGTHFNYTSLSFDALKDLWLGDDLASRAVEMIPREAMRQGYDLVISSAQDKGGSVSASGMDPAELAAEVSQKLDVLGVDEYLEVAGTYERGYGGGAILIGANDGQEDMTVPLNLQRVKSLDWLTPLEARELMPLYAYSDPRAPKFGQPEIYQLTSRSVLPSYSGQYSSTTMLIHESRLVVFPGIRVSRYQVTTSRGGWGESVLQRLYRVLRDFNTAWSSAGVLVSDFAQSVIKIAGLWEALALDGNGAFANRLAAMEYGRSVVNAVTIDAGDEYSRQSTPLTGLPDLLEKFAVRLAAACDMPLTLLFGTSPAGMNATGESDIRSFYDRVAAYQKRKMEPALRRLCQVLFRTMGSKREPDKWSIKFRPLWQDSAKDKAAAMLAQAQADTAWITAGVLSPEEIAAAHWGKGEYDPNITVDFEAREAQEMATAQPVLPEPEPDEYVPPPGAGSATPGADVPAPGEPAAPDPNTRPTSTVQAQDHMDDDRRDVDLIDVDEWDPSRSDARDERARFAGSGYGSDVPSSAQVSAKATHEKMAGEHAMKVETHAAQARHLAMRAQSLAAANDWDGFAEASRSSISHQSRAAQAMSRVAYHAERAGTENARGALARATLALHQRGDDWSEAAREAALEARRENAKGPEEKGGKPMSKAAAHAHEKAKQAREASAKAKTSGKAEDHERAAVAHQQAANAFERAGQKYSAERTEHAKESIGHVKEVGGAIDRERGERGEGPKGPAQKPAGPVPPPASPVPPPAGAKPVAASKSSSTAHAPAAKAAGGEKGHGEGEGGHKGKEHGEGGHKGKEHGESLLGKVTEFAKIAGETVGGKKAAEVAGQLAPVGGGHDHADEWSDAAREAAAEARRSNAERPSPSHAESTRRAEYASSVAKNAKGADRAPAHARASVKHEIAAAHEGVSPEKAAEHSTKSAEHAAMAEKLSNPGKRAPNAGMYAGAAPIQGAQSRTTEPTERGEVIRASHGLTDLSGRAVGGRAEISAVPGGHEVKLTPTRNGEKFGNYSGTNSTTHATLEAARAHANAGLDKQREHFLAKSAEVAARKGLAKDR